MKPSETVLFTDMDGTLLNSDSAVAREDREATAEYIRQGGRFGISTGRHHQNALRFLPGLEINAPSVIINGAAVYDFTLGRSFHTRYLRRETGDPALRKALETIPGVDLMVYTDDGIFYVTPREQAEPRLLELHQPCSFVSWDDLDPLPWIKCLVYAPPEHLEELSSLLSFQEGSGCALLPGSDGGRLRYCEVMPEGVSKGSALESLRSHPDLAGRTFFAMGDYWNDYELLTAADVPIAPANAIPEIRALARYVTVSNDEHAVARVLTELIPSL